MEHKIVILVLVGFFGFRYYSCAYRRARRRYFCRAESIGDSRALTSHAPIYIDLNGNFTNQAASEGWQGDGSAWNQYTIENYDITSESTTGIDLRNTDLYFVIVN